MFFAPFLALHSAAHSVCLRQPARLHSLGAPPAWLPGPLANYYALRFAAGNTQGRTAVCWRLRCALLIKDK